MRRGYRRQSWRRGGVRQAAGPRSVVEPLDLSSPGSTEHRQRRPHGPGQRGFRRRGERTGGGVISFPRRRAFWRPRPASFRWRATSFPFGQRVSRSGACWLLIFRDRFLFRRGSRFGFGGPIRRRDRHWHLIDDPRREYGPRRHRQEFRRRGPAGRLARFVATGFVASPFLLLATAEGPPARATAEYRLSRRGASRRGVGRGARCRTAWFRARSRAARRGDQQRRKQAARAKLMESFHASASIAPRRAQSRHLRG